MRRSHLLALAVLAAVVLAVVTAGCGSDDADASGVPELPATTTAELTRLLADSTRPVVLNVWASWCIPCRSEAPLLVTAAEQFEDRIEFIGLNVRDGQSGARSFIAEFFPDAPIEHFIDREGQIPIDLGGSRGVPLTFFFAAGGDLVEVHTGVIDERTLALQIDELLAR